MKLHYAVPKISLFSTFQRMTFFITINIDKVRNWRVKYIVIQLFNNEWIRFESLFTTI